eukprot:TRINITY_DN5329_c0_g1_i1.p1 TRINITY_DN5329_c0_g1~~TRINITY_DN5329_c0_g1_i1.p1  ORF type:complete len:271 (+),score=68.49 TRINITY_DN5329_c0_g1_i1:53-865(+)
MSDQELQEEEIGSLLAIYPDIIEVALPKLLVTVRSDCILTLKITDGYPSSRPPLYELNDLWKGSYQDEIHALLMDEFDPGESVIFTWIEALKAYLEDNHPLPEEGHPPAEVEHRPAEAAEEPQQPDTTTTEPLPVPDIHQGEPITDRKSTFQAFVAHVTSKKEVKLVLKALKANSKIARATHNMVAYRVSLPGGIVLSDYDDDGESGSASRMQHLMQIMGVENVVVMVSRWYGGIHLGPDRFKHINNATRNVLVQHGFAEPDVGGKGRKK